jgi:hypothetical protein
VTGSEAGDGIRCGAQWPSGLALSDGIFHECTEPFGHPGVHRCACGWPGPLTETETDTVP